MSTRYTKKDIRLHKQANKRGIYNNTKYKGIHTYSYIQLSIAFARNKIKNKYNNEHKSDEGKKEVPQQQSA